MLWMSSFFPDTFRYLLVHGRKNLPAFRVFQPSSGCSRCQINEALGDLDLCWHRGLHEALWNEQYPGRAFEELPIKFFVQRQKEPVDLSANCIVAAAEASGSVSPVIPIQHPSGTLGWLLLAYQVMPRQSVQFRP